MGKRRIIKHGENRWIMEAASNVKYCYLFHYMSIYIFLSYLCKRGMFVSPQTKLIKTLFWGGINLHCSVTNILTTNTFVCLASLCFVNVTENVVSTAKGTCACAGSGTHKQTEPHLLNEDFLL